MKSNHIPRILVDAFKQGRGIIFLGAGVSQAAGLPGWDQLIAELANELEIKPDLPGKKFSTNLLIMVPQYYENQYQRRPLLKKLEKLISGKYSHRPLHEIISQLPTDIFYTTNYDKLLEDELDKHGFDHDVIRDDETAINHIERTKRQVIKIHGSIKDYNSIVVTRRDYAGFSVKKQRVIDIFKHDLKTNVFLYVGYSLRDPDINNIMDNTFYQMRGLHQPHFICLENINDYERDDLTKRGINVLDISGFSGKTPTERLKTFLIELVELTSDLFHLRRFYSVFKKGADVPIIVTSRLHKDEHYVYYPACDIYVAHQLSQDLSRIGVDSKVICDVDALRKLDKMKKQDLILICSPFGNRFTEYFFEEAKKLGSPISQEFVQVDNQRQIKVSDDLLFIADDPLKKSTKLSNEYALIARYKNPWNHNKCIFVFAGLYALGTHAIGDYLKVTANYRQLINSITASDEIIFVLKATYSKYDPYNYRFKSLEKAM